MYRHKVTGKGYCGQTWNEEQRKWDHQHPNGGCPKFHNAIKKHGYNAFEYIVLNRGIDDQKELDRLEALAITENKTLHPDGYNLKISGQHGRMSDETRLKCVKSQLGRTHSEETKKKMSAWQIGKVTSEITRKRIGDAHRGRTISEDRKAKLSKRVRCVETGIVYKSIQDAGIAMGSKDGGKISHCLRRQSKTSSGYHWEFA